MGCCEVRGLLWRVGLFLPLLTGRPAAAGHVASNHGKGGRGAGECGTDRLPTTFWGPRSARGRGRPLAGRGLRTCAWQRPTVRGSEGVSVAAVGVLRRSLSGAQCSRRPLPAAERAEGARSWAPRPLGGHPFLPPVPATPQKLGVWG